MSDIRRYPDVGYRYWTSDIDFGNIGVILSQTAPHILGQLHGCSGAEGGAGWFY